MGNRVAPVALVLAGFLVPLLWTACGGGSDGPECTPQAEACNGLDDDCDGATDEADAQGCVTYLRDADGDGFGLSSDSICLCAAEAPHLAEEGGDCDDATDAVRPGAAEVCDGVDQDCDAETDEGIESCCEPGAELGCGVEQGTCRAGTQTCGGDRAWGACLDANGDPVTLPGQVAETCNGLDDDCDGQTDGALPAICYTGPPGTEGVGICQAGTRVCAGGTYGSCQDEVVPTTEICNGVDDDCDGATDQGNPGGGASCDGSDLDLCAEGILSCLDGVLACGDTTGDSVEECNGVDDDCDGQTDEGLTRPACALQLGVCAGSLASCGGTSGWICGATEYGASYQAAESFCDALDNDCDGGTDEPFQAGGTVTLTDLDGTAGLVLGSACGVGGCAGGTVVCSESRLALACTTHVNATAEACNGIDDDCDGATDEDVVQVLCEKQAGVCAGARKPSALCVSGAWLACNDDAYTAHSAAYQSVETTCDLLDNDCDGATDEGGCP